MIAPRVTVLMPVRNGAAHVRAAVDSVLAQTFADFELLVVDDGSTDDTVAILQSVGDPRLRVERNPSNVGVARSLNRGLDLARGAYVARMDADDLSRSDRLQRQVEFMDAHPGLAVSGMWMRFFGDEMPVVERKPVGAAHVKAYLTFTNPLCHPSVILRKSMMDAHALRYDPSFGRSEDFDLWSRMARVCDLDNQAVVGLRFRIHGGSVTKNAADEMTAQTRAILARGLADLGVDPTPAELEFHRQIGHGCRMGSLAQLLAAADWLQRLIRSNDASGRHDPAVFADVVSRIWFRLCANSGNLGVRGLSAWHRSELSRPRYLTGADEQVRFVASVFWNAVRGSARATA